MNLVGTDGLEPPKLVRATDLQSAPFATLECPHDTFIYSVYLLNCKAKSSSTLVKKCPALNRLELPSTSTP